MPRTPSDPVGVGIVGLGVRGWAARTHLPALRASADFHVVGAVASTPESSKRAAQEFGLQRAYPDLPSLLADDDIGLVVVAVKVPAHDEPILRAIDAGRMVLSEWPLAADLGRARALADRARQAGVRTAVGLQAASAPRWRQLRDLLAAGLVGRVLSTTVVGAGRNWGPTFPARAAYQLDAGAGATLLTIPTAHTLDAMSTVLGPVTSASGVVATRRRLVHEQESGAPAEMSAPDEVAFIATFGDGVVGTVHLSGGAPAGTAFRWRIVGTDGVVAVDADWAHPQFGEVAVTVLRDGHAAEPIPVDLSIEPDVGLPPEHPGFNVAHAYRRFADDLRTGSRRVPDFDAGVALLELLANI